MSSEFLSRSNFESTYATCCNGKLDGGSIHTILFHKIINNITKLHCESNSNLNLLDSKNTYANTKDFVLVSSIVYSLAENMVIAQKPVEKSTFPYLFYKKYFVSKYRSLTY